MQKMYVTYGGKGSSTFQDLATVAYTIKSDDDYDEISKDIEKSCSNNLYIHNVFKINNIKETDKIQTDEIQTDEIQAEVINE